MVVKVYVSGMSGNKEVKKRQQRVLLILDSKNIKYEVLDIAEPNMEEAKDYMQNNSKLMGGTIGDPNPRHPLPPQIFNDDEYCGDYDAFDMANEVDEMEKFLKLALDEIPQTQIPENVGNGEVPKSKESSPEKVQENGNDQDEAEDIVQEDVKEKSPTPVKENDASKDEGVTIDSDEERDKEVENGSKEEIEKEVEEES
ncbi:hypothetical protein ABEB36_013064 [Hypothenemus hampei]|uniref:SH3 domain-binding glutamic acid-rich protein n=1 Tax=Hypothenemus hampei TaxID=57062 RepID=A0ABD1E6R7_HYPHA